jgi:hypothetical protein
MTKRTATIHSTLLQAIVIADDGACLFDIFDFRFGGLLGRVSRRESVRDVKKYRTVPIGAL